MSPLCCEYGKRFSPVSETTTNQHPAVHEGCRDTLTSVIGFYEGPRRRRRSDRSAAWLPTRSDRSALGFLLKGGCILLCLLGSSILLSSIVPWIPWIIESIAEIWNATINGCHFAFSVGGIGLIVALPIWTVVDPITAAPVAASCLVVVGAFTVAILLASGVAAWYFQDVAAWIEESELNEKLTASFCLLKKELLLLITAVLVCGFVLSKVLSNTDVVGGIAMMEMIVLVHCTRRSLLALGFR